MRKPNLVSMIDEVLSRHGLHRIGDTWSRDHTDYVDIIDLQISQLQGRFTLNIGVVNKFVTRTCWGLDDLSLIEEPLCTVRTRLGELLYRRDVWWSISDELCIQEALSGIQDAAIPFFQRNHSIAHMISALESDPASRRYPPGAIYLALLYHQIGSRERCKDLFRAMQLTGAWSRNASDILTLLD